MERYKILTGPHAGEIHDGEGCNARPYPNCPENLINWDKHQDGIWIPALNMRLKQRHNPDSKGWSDAYLDYENLVVPFDRYKQEIKVGDVIFYSARDLQVCRLKVEKLGNIHHAGCGWLQRIMHGTDLDSKKKTKNSYPSRCIKA